MAAACSYLVLQKPSSTPFLEHLVNPGKNPRLLTIPQERPFVATTVQKFTRPVLFMPKTEDDAATNPNSLEASAMRKVSVCQVVSGGASESLAFSLRYGEGSHMLDTDRV